MRTLVLWDIDLTLLDLRRIGATWFQRALTEITGRRLGTTPSFAGRTDQWITRQMLLNVDVEPTPELITRIHAHATELADAERHMIAERGLVLPGVADVLREIAGKPDVVQTLVTGNLKAIAAFKVEAFGLDKYLDLEIGGYGEMSEDRAVLVAEAVAGARKQHAADFTAVVVGDTPHDIHGALAHQARAVGVATGSFPADALHTAGAHVVLPDLSDTTLALTAILN